MLPSLPTDNLYKFAALAGLALILFALTYPAQLAFRLQQQRVDLTYDRVVLNKEIDHIERELAYLKTSSSTKIGDVSRLEQRVDAVALKRIGLDRKTALADLLRDQIYFLGSIALLALLVGGKLTWWGFSNWYHRIQVPADHESESRKAAGKDT